MVAVSDLELVQLAPASLLSHIGGIEAAIVEQLQTSASTVLVNGLRTRTMERTIVAVGTMHTFEALLQIRYGWNNVFGELDAALLAKSRYDLVERFRDYRDAVNVLKHGRGRSYDRLLDRREQLQFEVKGRDSAFLHEGDVSEVSRLVAADTRFVEQCIAIIVEICSALDLK